MPLTSFKQTLNFFDTETKQLAELILASSSHGIMVADSNSKIRWVNKAFESVTGYTLAEVEGKSPRVLSSGCHGPNFYRKIWKQVDVEGSWQGEIINRRKNGEHYSEFLNIVSLKDREGKVVRYAGLFIDLTNIKTAEEKIKQMAYFDGLTGLASRAYFLQYLETALKTHERRNYKLALLFIDLDKFKLVNDAHGHSVGDNYLKIISDRLRNTLRESDFAARLGGDEFCIIVENINKDDSAGKIACNCLNAIRKPIEIGDQVFHPKASVGIAYFPDDALSGSALLKSADHAMYAAKARGNQYSYFDSEMAKSIDLRLGLEHDLQFAIDNGELFLEYQPKVNIRNGQIEGVEALIRWMHPNQGLIAPNVFIGIAERLGIIDKVGLWVVDQSCKQLIDWKNQGIECLTIAVNISSSHFESEHFLEDIEQILLQNEVAPDFIEIEITESMARNVDSHTRTCEELYSRGYKIAIDDFGTGYSSLNILKSLRVNTLKIDKTFIDDLPSDRRTAATLLGGILALAHGLNFNTVVEGVETRDQLVILYGLGCKLVQGFFFSRPVAPEVIPGFVKKGFCHLMRQECEGDRNYVPNGDYALNDQLGPDTR